MRRDKGVEKPSLSNLGKGWQGIGEYACDAEGRVFAQRRRGNWERGVPLVGVKLFGSCPSLIGPDTAGAESMVWFVGPGASRCARLDGDEKGGSSLVSWAIQGVGRRETGDSRFPSTPGCSD